MYCVSYQRLLIVAVLFFARLKCSMATFEAVDPIKDDDVNVRHDYLVSPQVMETQNRSVETSSELKVTNTHDMDDHRELILDGTVPCNGGAGPINYFTIDFRLTPQGGWNLSGCSSTAMKTLGNALNAFLFDYGIGRSGEGDKIAFVGLVCNAPKVVNTRRRDRSRELVVLNFI